MDVVSLSPTNFIGLSSTYGSDDALSLKQNFYLTEQGYNLPFTELYADLSDTTTNNYSNLYLTRYDTLTSNVAIVPPGDLPVNSITTYLATLNTPDINDSTRFIVTQEPDLTVNTANVTLSGTIKNIDNTYFYQIIFINDVLCKVVHSSYGAKRYLTALGNTLVFQFDAKDDAQGTNSSQIFYYIYDSKHNIILLTKSLPDNSNNNICEYVGYTDDVEPRLVFVKPEQGLNSPYPPNTAWLCTPQPGAKVDPVLYDAWVSYNRNLLTNSQDINPDRSTTNVNTNLLINTQFNDVATSNMLNVNILSLKNTNTPENYQGRGNPFQNNRSEYLAEDDVSSRTYHKLFTGSNQSLGNDNINLGYDTYTTGITLPADQITYFHTPQNTYPYIQINVADAGFIEAGAIAGDHPMKSDKIFKKLASAKYTSPFGRVTDETSGSFLCSWLSGSSDVNTKPVWVDRYYNPSKTTYIAALQNNSNYVTIFDTLLQSASSQIGDASVFDKPSDLTLQPGAYYAYQHIGKKYVNQYIQSFNPSLVDNTFSAYLDYNQQNVLLEGMSAKEFVFDGNRYTISNSLSAIEESNQFTLAFNGYSRNWQQTLGYQLVGNYIHDGFGIFNNNTITSAIYIPTSGNILYLNTDLKVIRTLPSQAILLGQMNFEGLRDNYGLFNDGTFRRYDAQGIPLQITSNDVLNHLIDYDYTSDAGYIFGNDVDSNPKILLADFAHTTLTDVTDTYDQEGFLNTPPGFTINDAMAVVYYNGQLYLPPGVEGRLINDQVYFIGDDYESLIRWNLTTNTLTTAFRAQGTMEYSYISDYSIDINQNLWLINGNNSFYKYTLNRDFILSGYLPPNTTIPVKLNLTGDGETTTFALPAEDYAGRSTFSQNPNDYVISYTYTTTISALSSNGSVSRIASFNTQTHTSTYLPNFEYTIQDNNIVFYSAPANTYSISVSTNVPWDSYGGTGALQVNFINDFDNGQYSQFAIITRYGYDPITYNGSYQISKLSTNGNLVLSATFEAPLSPGTSVYYGENYLRNYVFKKYLPANLNVKAVLTNVYDSNDNITSEIITSLSAVDPGSHHFAVRFDSYNGEMALFIDGINVGQVYFEPRKYDFSNLIKRPFMFGTAAYRNNIPLFKYLKKQAFLVKGLTITDYKLYSTPLNDFDIKFLAKQNMNIQDLVVDIPCGRRNYVEEIERYFKATIPGSKSTLYNFNITNTGITDRSLQQALEARIIKELQESAPAYSQLNSINWIN
jgi:hypothetical protein